MSAPFAEEGRKGGRGESFWKTDLQLNYLQSKYSNSRNRQEGMSMRTIMKNLQAITRKASEGKRVVNSGNL